MREKWSGSNSSQGHRIATAGLFEPACTLASHELEVVEERNHVRPELGQLKPRPPTATPSCGQSQCQYK